MRSISVSTRKSYPSDLTDEQWGRIESIVSHDIEGAGRPRKVDLREVVNAILYRGRCSCPWNMLPHDLPPMSTVYEYYRKWSDDGTWQQLEELACSKLAHTPP